MKTLMIIQTWRHMDHKGRRDVNIFSNVPYFKGYGFKYLLNVDQSHFDARLRPKLNLILALI